MNVLAGEDAGLDTVAGRTRLYIGKGRLHGFVHHLAKLAGGPDGALSRDGDRFDGQQLAANFGPGEASNGADLVLLLTDAVAELPHPGIFGKIFRRDRDLLENAF